MIKFVTESEEIKNPTFGDVEENQFFIDGDGYLSQKNSHDRYFTIANNHGKPCSCLCDDVSGEDTIIKILPKITKIEF